MFHLHLIARQVEQAVRVKHVTGEATFSNNYRDEKAREEKKKKKRRRKMLHLLMSGLCWVVVSQMIAVIVIQDTACHTCSVASIRKKQVCDY